MWQYLAAQAVKDIGLVRVEVRRAMQLGRATARHHLGVMPGGDEVCLNLFGVGPKLAELEPAVANDTGVRRTAGKVFVGEVVDDTVEVALEIQGVKGDVELVSNSPRVAGINGAAAAFLAIGPAVLFRMRARTHEQTNDVVALLPQQQCR